MKIAILLMLAICLLAVGCADNPIPITPIGESTPLHEAVRTGDIDAVRLLIAVGANVNAGNQYGWTPLYQVSSVEIVIILIEAGANVNARNSDGWTPLHFVRTAEIAVLLIQAGADVNARTKPIIDPTLRPNNGFTPLGSTNSDAIADIIRAAGGVE